MDIIVDIDGTIADCRHRRKFVIDGARDWRSFYESMTEDESIEPVCIVATCLWAAGHRIIITTGRPAQYFQHTIEWLNRKDINFHTIRMRSEWDYREDSIVKEEMLKELRAEGYDPKLALDDREPVVQMWRRNGIICLQNSMRELPL
jgi:uncharacterized HAD superfamily protein